MGELERRVEQLLGLKEVLIVDEIELESKADHMQRVNEEALLYLSRIINKGGYDWCFDGENIEQHRKCKEKCG